MIRPGLMTDEQKYTVTLTAWNMMIRNAGYSAEEAEDMMADWAAKAQIEMERCGWPGVIK